MNCVEPDYAIKACFEFEYCIISVVSLYKENDDYPGLEVGKTRFHVSSHDTDYEVDYDDNPKLLNYRILANLFNVRPCKSDLDLKETDNIIYDGGDFTVNGVKVEL